MLEKVQRFGQASLSEREHKILLKASEVYKQREDAAKELMQAGHWAVPRDV